MAWDPSSTRGSQQEPSQVLEQKPGWDPGQRFPGGSGTGGQVRLAGTQFRTPQTVRGWTVASLSMYSILGFLGRGWQLMEGATDPQGHSTTIQDGCGRLRGNWRCR